MGERIVQACSVFGIRQEQKEVRLLKDRTVRTRHDRYRGGCSCHLADSHIENKHMRRNLAAQGLEGVRFGASDDFRPDINPTLSTTLDLDVQSATSMNLGLRRPPSQVAQKASKPTRSRPQTRAPSVLQKLERMTSKSCTQQISHGISLQNGFEVPVPI